MKTVQLKITKKMEVADISSLTQVASASISTIEIIKGNTKVDCKSILGLFTLGLKAGDEVTIQSLDEGIVTTVIPDFLASIGAIVQ